MRYGIPSCPTAEELARRKQVLRRSAWGLVAAAAIGALAWKAVTAPDGVADPTAPGAHLSHGAVVVDSALLVFREGLEAVLVLAAFTASFVGANRALRRPVAAGAGVALVASVATWFVAIALIGLLGGPGLDVQAGTGLLAVAVLLVVMNWFFHKIYWTGWISAHNRRRRQLVADDTAARRLLLGLALLGFTAVYREGFEVVLFLQNLRLQAGSTTVLEGVALGLALTVAVGLITFAVQHRLPYRRMLVATGILLGLVLLVMVGESVQELQLAGWLPTHGIGVAFPGWLGLWFALFPTIEGLVAQTLAAGVVVGSYVLAERRSDRRSRAEPPARRAAPITTLAEEQA
jgi:high-affinity iron transporter